MKIISIKIKFYNSFEQIEKMFFVCYVIDISNIYRL